MDFKKLLAYQKAFSLAMEIKKVSDSFPKEEKYNRHYCALGFFESYYINFKEELENQEQSVTTENE